MDKIVYFDNAATTYPKPEEVYAYTDRCFREFCVNVGRGQSKLSSYASNVMDETRELMLNLFHAGNKKMIFTHTATEAINLLILNSVKDNMNIYISPFEHNAVTRTLEHLRNTVSFNVIVLPFSVEKWEYDIEEIKNKFEKARPGLMIISHASNVCGYISPIKILCDLSKQYKCVNIIDMCQTAGLIDTSLASDNIDFAVFDGHKTLYSPLGVAGVVGKSFSGFDPLIYGGTGIESRNQDMPSSVPERFEAGSHNIVAISGLNAAIKWINGIGIEKLVSKERDNHRNLISMMSKHHNIKIVSPFDDFKCVGIISCIFFGYSSENIGNVLNQKSIAVRTGLQCAPLAHRTLCTFPAGTVRFSSSWFTNSDDFEQLDEALSYIEENS